MLEELQLLRGDPIEVQGIKIYQPTIGDITNLTVKVYEESLSLVLIKRAHLDKIFEQFDNPELDKLSNFELLLLLVKISPEFLIVLENACKLFFHTQQIEIDIENGQLILGLQDEIKLVDKDLFVQLSDVIKVQNNLLKPEEIMGQPSSAKAREILEKMQRARAKVEEIKAKQRAAQGESDSVQLHDLIMGVVFEVNGLTPYNIWDLPVYAMYKYFSKSQKREEYRLNIEKALAGVKLENKLLHWLF